MRTRLDAVRPPSPDGRRLDGAQELGAEHVAELQREIATLQEMRGALDRIRRRMLRRLVVPNGLDPRSLATDREIDDLAEMDQR